VTAWTAAYPPNCSKRDILCFGLILLMKFKDLMLSFERGKIKDIFCVYKIIELDILEHVAYYWLSGN
jgi:hypothetical protein